MVDTAREAGWLEHTAGVRVLDDHRVLAVRGDDARAWLNGQVTNDLRGLVEGGSVYALVLNARGKVLADAFVLDRGAAGLALVVPAGAVDELRAHFEKYIIMEDVEVVLDDATRVVTIQGPESPVVVERARKAGLACAVFPCPRLGLVGFDLLLPADTPDLLLTEACEGRVVSGQAWELAAARLGVAAFAAEFREHYPQEAGLRERAVSFTKGCYLGQEVVCMLENRGQLVRKLVQLVTASGDRPAASTAVEAEDGTTIGEVTSAVVDTERDRSLAFAYVKRMSAVPGARVTAGGRPATIERVLAADV